MKKITFFFIFALLFPLAAKAQDCGNGRWGPNCGTPCYADCKTCSGGNPNQCTSCPSGTFLVPESNPNNTNCKSCSSLHPISNGYCTSCTQSSCSVVTCYSGYKVSGKSCVKISCSAGQYLSGNTCYSCHVACKTCTGSSMGDCTSCYDGLELKNGQCVRTSCPEGQYISGIYSQNCSACDPSCKTCSAGGENNCTSCPSGSILQNGKCVQGNTIGKCPSETTKSSDGCCCAPNV